MKMVLIIAAFLFMGCQQQQPDEFSGTNTPKNSSDTSKESRSGSKAGESESPKKALNTIREGDGDLEDNSSGQDSLAKKDTRPVDDYEPVPGYTLSCSTEIDDSRESGTKKCFLADENGEMVDMENEIQSYSWQAELPDMDDVEIEELEPVPGEFHFGFAFEADEENSLLAALKEVSVALDIIGHDNEAKTVKESKNKGLFSRSGEGGILDQLFNRDEADTEEKD